MNRLMNTTVRVKLGVAVPAVWMIIAADVVPPDTQVQKTTPEDPTTRMEGVGTGLLQPAVRTVPAVPGGIRV
jgi:hypothetical protein